MNNEPVMCECGNCSWRGDVSECNEIHKLLDRIEVGDEFPAGECPQCGALAHLAKEAAAESSAGPSRVILSVSGGVADVIFKPVGVDLTVLDYDVDGVETNTTDPDGQMCTIAHWASEQKVVSYKHWPMVKQASRDVTCRCTRQWTCSSCRRVLEISYEEVVEIGVPYCPDCQIEMNMA